MAVGAARGWHDHPAPRRGHEVADEVVRKLVARGDSATATLYPEPPTSKLIQPCIAGLANGLRCLYVSAQVAAVQMSDVGLSFVDVSP